MSQSYFNILKHLYEYVVNSDSSGIEKDKQCILSVNKQMRGLFSFRLSYVLRAFLHSSDIILPEKKKNFSDHHLHHLYYVQA